MNLGILFSRWRKKPIKITSLSNMWRIWDIICVIIGIASVLSLNPCMTQAVGLNKVRRNVIGKLESVWTKLRQGLNRSGNNPEDVLKELGSAIVGIPEEIDKVEKDLLVYEYEEGLKSVSTVKTYKTFIPMPSLNNNLSIKEWRKRWSEISRMFAPADIAYGYLKLFTDSPESFVPGSGYLDYDANTLAKFILEPLYKRPNSTKKSPYTLKYLVTYVHDLTVSHKKRGRKNAFTLLHNYIEKALPKSNWCLWNSKTPQQLVYGLYSMLSVLDLKEYALFNFAWMLRFALNETEPGKKLEDSKFDMEIRLEEKAASAKSVLDKASSAYWRCDPDKYEKGKSYVEFQELLQGYIENEKNMHPSGSCRHNCDKFTSVRAFCPYTDKATCFQHQVCTGRIYDCKFVASDSTVCPAASPRRYDYIQYKKGPTYGSTSGRCTQETQKKDSFWRLIVHCSNCFCLCDDPNSPTTIRHVSLVPVLSDVKANKIVSGVRFVMVNGVLQLQIEEGEMAKEGVILDESTVWKPTPRVNKKDKKQAVQLDYKRRAFDLDDLLVPKDHVVTGVRFRTLGNHVNLQIQGTQVDPKTGRLKVKHQRWVGNDNRVGYKSNVPRVKLTLDLEADVPTKARKPNVPDSVHDMYVIFGPTSAQKDVAQTTIPFIDTQEVRPRPPVWLKGVGVYHKGQWGYGGFIAPRVFTHSAAEFLQAGGDDDD